MIRKLLIGTISLFGLFAVAGTALFFAEPAAAQIVGVDSAEGITDQIAFRRGEGQRGRRSILTREEKAEVVADVLGITVEELAEAREADMDKEALAEANGTTVDAINDAIYTASVDKVNELVASGELTEEEGAAILEKLELRKLAYDIIDRDVLKQAAADAIGVSVEELEAAKEARTFSELLEENDVTREEVKEAVEAAKNQMIDEALANGDITEEQAEQLREMGLRGKGNRGGGRPGSGGPADEAPTNTDEA